MFLNLMIAHGLKIIANFTNYFDDNPGNTFTIELLNVYLNNLLHESLQFFYSDFSGFTSEEKERKCDKISNNSSFRISFSLASFLIVIFIISNLICKINFMELNFLDKLINFSSSNFDDYLKNLEELKKKFRDDTNDEEDKNIDEPDIGVDDIDIKDENNYKNDINFNNKFSNFKQNQKKKKNAIK